MAPERERRFAHWKNIMPHSPLISVMSLLCLSSGLQSSQHTLRRSVCVQPPRQEQKTHFAQTWPLALPIASSSSRLLSSSQGTTDDIIAEGPARSPDRRRANVAGNLFVDEGCIDCDVCRWMAPKTFGRVGIKAAVVTQPVSEEARLQAMAAAISCPVGSIRTEQVTRPAARPL